MINKVSKLLDIYAMFYTFLMSGITYPLIGANTRSP
jgi:hypothetical protein